MKILLLFCSCYIMHAAFAQVKPSRIGNDLSDSVERIVYSLDTAEIYLAPTKHLLFDSVDVNYKKSAVKIETINFFKKSGSKVLIDYFFNNGSLLMVKVKEISPWFSDLFSAKIYYYSHDTIEYRRYFGTVRSCMAKPLDKSIYELYGYNPAFGGDFFETYCKRLLTHIFHNTSTLKKSK